MADVAREAGVSLMTVSRAINGKEGISHSTRERIQDIIDRLGYRPSEIARSLVTDRTSTIGLVVIDNTNPFFSEFARGVEHEAYAHGYNVFLCNTDEDIEREQAILHSLEEKRVDGIILCSPRLDESPLRSALKRHAAVVIINRRLTDSRLGMILVDDERGGRMVTEHLLSRGHRAIGYLSGPHRSFSGQLRATGYRGALRAAGIDPRPDWELDCLPVVESGREAALDLLTRQPELSALFCYNDLSAVAEDMAVAGFDDIPLAAWVTPSLTTCHVPMCELGSRAMRLLVEHIEGCESTCEDILIEPELIIRDSAP
jgi:LacI family transcriptional regulator